MKRFHIHGTALEVADLCVAKNRAYGDSVGKSAQALALLYPRGMRPHQYLDALMAARDFDKRSRLAQLTDTDADPLGEDPRLDIAGYALLALHYQKENEARCQGAASSIPAPAASAAPATPDSAAQHANESTTPKSGEPSGPKNSPSPDGSSASTSASASISTDSAPAPTASTPAPASANAAARARYERAKKAFAVLSLFTFGLWSGLWLVAFGEIVYWASLAVFVLAFVALGITAHQAHTGEPWVWSNDGFFDQEED